jgi:hypothetical protein
MKLFFKNFLLVFFSIFFLLIIIEVLLRVTGSKPRQIIDISGNEDITNSPDSKLGWVPKKGIHKFKPWAKEGKETFLTINSDKSRFNGNKDKDFDKIIFIGGSITQGWAVSDNETFPYLLQEKTLRHKIYNFGVGGYGGYQSLLTLERVFKNKKNIKLVVYGFIPHHEVRNVASGSWLYLLNTVSERGLVSLPFGSINKKNKLIRHDPIIYLKLPLGDKLALVAKIEKRLMKIMSSSRERKQTQISLAIINEMKKLAVDNKSKFILLILDKFTDEREDKYKVFLDEKKVSYVECIMPQGKKYKVPGEGHPNEISHAEISECVFEKLKLRDF